VIRRVLRVDECCRQGGGAARTSYILRTGTECMLLTVLLVYVQIESNLCGVRLGAPDRICEWASGHLQTRWWSGMRGQPGGEPVLEWACTCKGARVCLCARVCARACALRAAYMRTARQWRSWTCAQCRPAEMHTCTAHTHTHPGTHTHTHERNHPPTHANIQKSLTTLCTPRTQTSVLIGKYTTQMPCFQQPYTHACVSTAGGPFGINPAT